MKRDGACCRQEAMDLLTSTMGESLALFLIVGSEALADGHVRSRLSVVQFRLRTLLMDKKSQELDW